MKIVIPRSQIPNPSDSTFYLRFRLISEDRNRLSAWTPIFQVSSDYAYIQPSTGFVSDILANQVFS